MKVAAIYCRVSSKGQEDNASLPTQEAACREYAVKQGYEVAEVYREVHTGAELTERPAMARLRAAVRASEVRAVIAYSVDRLSRNQAHIYILLDEADRAGVRLLFATEEFEDTPIGKFLLGARTFAAELERENIKDRAMRGRGKRWEAGKLAGNTPAPYGYRYNDGKTAYLVDEATAPVVRRIFDLAAGGMPLRSIGTTLAAEGIASPTGLNHWAHTSVRKVLANESYTGTPVHRKTGVAHQRGKRTIYHRPAEEHVALDGACPPLVDRATFDAVQARLARNAAEAVRNCRNPEAYLLRGGYLRDAATGRAMIADRNNKGTPQYRHRVLRPLPGDREHVIGATTLDREIWAFLTHILSDREFLERETAALAGGEGDWEELASVGRSAKAVAKQQGNIAAMAALIDDEEARAPLAAQLQQLAERKKGLEAERDGLVARAGRAAALRSRLDGLAEMGAGFARRAAGMTYEERREWLAILGLRVEMRPAGAEPRYSMSLGIPLPDGSEHRIAYRNTSIPA